MKKIAFLLNLIFAYTTTVQASGRPVIFDTDSNYFADDCLALGMMLHQEKEFPILGVTVVAGTQYPLQGAEHLTHVLGMFNRSDVPVYLGADKPLVNNAERVEIMKREWGLGFAGAFELPIPTPDTLTPPIGGVFSGIRTQSQSAHDFLISKLEEATSPIIVVAIGPMTNIARIVTERPDLLAKIDELIFMGGNLRVPGNVTQAAEFNFWFDPEAAQIVLRSNIQKKTMIGLDLTQHARFMFANYLEVASIQTPLAQTFAFELWELWPGFKNDSTITHYIWDAIVPVLLTTPSIITSSENLFLDVETEFGPEYGAVKERKMNNDQTPVKLLTGLDYPLFYGKFIELIGKNGKPE